MARVNVTKGKGSFGAIQKVQTDFPAKTSANDYPAAGEGTDAFEWEGAYLLRERTIYIFNTGATNTLRYKISVRPSDPTISTRTVLLPEHDGSTTDNDIAPGGCAIINVWEACDAINAFVKSKTSGQHSTYLILGVGHMFALTAGR